MKRIVNNNGLSLVHNFYCVMLQRTKASFDKILSVSKLICHLGSVNQMLRSHTTVNPFKRSWCIGFFVKDHVTQFLSIHLQTRQKKKGWIYLMRVVGEEKTIEYSRTLCKAERKKEYDIKYFILLSFFRNWEKTLEYFVACRFH